MNHYDALEVSPKASPEVIRAAYKSLVQRYHPDKNPGNAESAARAMAVVQAYEVLSNPTSRAAYDGTLKVRPAAPPPPAAAAPSYRPRAAKAPPGTQGLGWLLAIVILGGGAGIAFMSRKPVAAPPGYTAQRAPTGQVQTAAADPGPGSAPLPAPEAARPRTLLLWNTVQRIDLLPGAAAEDSAPGESPRHTLWIPALALEIGSVDAERFAPSLERQKDAVAEKLAQKLVHLSYAELNTVDADLYLKSYILAALRELTGSHVLDDSGTPEPAPNPRYGVVEISLPQSFSLR